MIASPAPTEPSILPWVAMGTGAATLGAAIALGISNANARSELEGSIHGGPEKAELQARIHDHGLAANVLFVAAAAAIATTVVLFLIE